MVIYAPDVCFEEFAGAGVRLDEGSEADRSKQYIDVYSLFLYTDQPHYACTPTRATMLQLRVPSPVSP